MQPVVVGLSGGLGNQMFQYATGRSIAARFEVALILDLSWFGGQKQRKFALEPFCTAALTDTQFPWLPLQGRAFVSRLSRRWMPRIMGVPVFRESHFHFVTEFDSLASSVFLDGYWQSERYFQNIRPVLLEEFTLREPLPYLCLKMLEKIQACDAICVHVRRGDYLSNPIAAQVHGICSLDYYISGVTELSKGLDSPHCFVFSDDIDWVKGSLNLGCSMTVVDLNGPEDAHLDLILMAACHHFLIANSSLSWWGAWLGKYDRKKVIAPSRWFSSNEMDTRDLIPASWMRR